MWRDIRASAQWLDTDDAYITSDQEESENSALEEETAWVDDPHPYTAFRRAAGLE